MAHYHAGIRTSRIQNFINRLAKEIVIEWIPFEAKLARSSQPIPFARRLELSYAPLKEGEGWGSTWQSAWVELKATVPTDWAGAYVTARLDFGGETLVFDADGTPRIGLTSGSVFDRAFNKDMLHLFPSCRGGEAVELWLEVVANGLFGVGAIADPAYLDNPAHLHGHHAGSAKAIRLCRFDHDRWQLWLDATVLFDLMKGLSDKTARHMQLLRGLNGAIDAYSTGGTRAARAALAPLLAIKSDPMAIDVTGVGHAHIDTAWLWPFRETIRKCGRTFASQIDLIRRYPGYVFGASQAQLYAYTKQHYPTLYEKIKAAVKAGTWEVQGGMWVEADCNLISGESMIRQFVHGKNFFRDEFGLEIKNLWLPDVFGYSGNLPQILRKAGMGYFLTQKLSWNKYNTFPHNTFWWRGIDGSTVLTHFPPEDNYNSSVMPSDLGKAETNNKERGIVGEAISLFGIGDGGGGPKEEHIERALRLRDLNGSPRFRFGPAQPVLEAMGRYGDMLDTWSGELYFEYHRGTYTTQAAVKRWNRRLEEALRATEMLCAAAGLASYPAVELDAVWKALLVNQFHDIIPGSSIHMVYEETVPMLQEGCATCKRLAAAAAARLGKADADALALFNPSSTPFTGIVRLPEGWTGATASGQALPTQREGAVAVTRVTVAPRSFLTLKRADAASPALVTRPATGAALVLENAEVRYEFGANLTLTRAFDKTRGVEIIRPGASGNVFSLYEDRPHSFDAWDIDEFYRDELVGTAVAATIERLEGGAARTGLRTTLSIGESTITQTIWLEPAGRRLDFVTEVDWKERHKMLRVAFPTTIDAPQAAFEIQYGHVYRTTHENTNHDRAAFEVCGHRFADLARRDYGVALLNDSKYGYRVKDGELDLNLLRAPTHPDPIADVGHHSFTYSLLPHDGDLLEGETVHTHAAILNQGLELLPGLAMEGAKLPVSLSGAGLELAVVKRAEKEDCLIVRVVERRGFASTGELVAANPAATFIPTDLMEWNDGPAAGTGRVALALAPFEIRTYKLKL